MKNNVLYYSVGPLLYCPANRISITDSLINEKFGNRFSLALCLEDTINDDHVEEAEQILISSLSQIFIQHEQKPFYLPKIFIRVRNPQQEKICSRIFHLSENQRWIFCWQDNREWTYTVI